MTAPPDGELLSLLEGAVEGFLAQRHDPRRLRETEVAFDRLWPEMAELGLLGLALAEADGGPGLGPRAIAAVARILGRRLAPEPFVACAILPGALISALPAGPDRTGLAAALASGEERFGFAWQEAPGQIGPWPARTSLDAQGRLDGRKIAVAAPGRRLFVTAAQDGRPALALVELAAGETAVRRASDGAADADVGFAGARIAGEGPLLRDEAAVAAVGAALDLGTLAASAHLAGVAAGALELTLEHLKTRTQFGKPIGAFQALQHRAVDMRIGLALCDASVREACRVLEEAPGSSHATAAVSAAKARTGAAALAVCKEAIQMHGALGFTEDSDVGLFVRAALRGSSWLGGARDHRRRFVAQGGELIHGG